MRPQSDIGVHMCHRRGVSRLRSPSWVYVGLVSHIAARFAKLGSFRVHVRRMLGPKWGHVAPILQKSWFSKSPEQRGPSRTGTRIVCSIRKSRPKHTRCARICIKVSLNITTFTVRQRKRGSEGSEERRREGRKKEAPQSGRNGGSKEGSVSVAKCCAHTHTHHAHETGSQFIFYMLRAWSNSSSKILKIACTSDRSNCKQLTVASVAVFSSNMLGHAAIACAM